MATVPKEIQNWLYNILSNEYHYLNQAFADVIKALARNRTFYPRSDVYTHENGQSSLLLHLDGTLPVSFRGRNYMFPIAIWIPHPYPKVGPMVYIIPTKGMTIRSSQYVSVEGRVYHPYLAGWREDRSSLDEFLVVLQDMFGREPPVIAKGATNQTPRHYVQQQSGNPPPRPPLPPELERSESQEVLQRQQSITEPLPPPPPPRPYERKAQTQAADTHVAPSVPVRPRNYGDEHYNGYSRGPPQMPQHVPQRSGSFVQALGTSNIAPYRGDQQAHRQASYVPNGVAQSGVYPQRSEYLANTQYANEGSASPSLPEQSMPAISAQLHHGPLDPFKQDPRGPPQHYTPQHPQQVHTPRSTLHSKAPPPADLLTSPFDNPLSTSAPPNIPAPPIPPNPEKDALLATISGALRQQLRLQIDSNASALSPLRAQHTALNNTIHAMESELSQLNNLSTMLTSNENILRKAMEDADGVMEDAKRRKEPPAVDEVLVAPTVVGGQLYELVAEELAIEEARGVVGRGLDRGRIGVEVWAKQTRSLAREQFLKKALIKKIAKEMGLSEERWS